MLKVNTPSKRSHDSFVRIPVGNVGLGISVVREDRRVILRGQRKHE